MNFFFFSEFSHFFSSDVKMNQIKVNVIVINLLCRKSRRQRILKLISLLKIASQKTEFPIHSVSILEAVDGVHQSFPQLQKRYGLKPFPNWAAPSVDDFRFPSSWRSNQTSGGIASGLSHLDVACVAASNEDESNEDSELTLVMEDDCVLTVPPEAAYTYFINCLKEAMAEKCGWDMILLGASGMRPDIAPPQPLGMFIERAGFSYLTTMYWLSLRGAKKLTECRKTCIENCLAFDELHNALAGLTGKVRRDVDEIFGNLPRLDLLSSIQSLVRQDPFDGVHDTVVIASSRNDVNVDVDPPAILSHYGTGGDTFFHIEKLTSVALTVQPGRVEMDIVWYRRQMPTANLEEIRQELGIKESPSRRSSMLRRPRTSLGGGGLLAVLAKIRIQKINHPFERKFLFDFNADTPRHFPFLHPSSCDARDKSN